MRVDGSEWDPKGWFTPHVQNPEKYPDCTTDLIGGSATQTFARGGKYPHAATETENTLWMIMKYVSQRTLQ